jgi:hypothetical protein
LTISEGCISSEVILKSLSYLTGCIIKVENEISRNIPEEIKPFNGKIDGVAIYLKYI